MAWTGAMGRHLIPHTTAHTSNHFLDIDIPGYIFLFTLHLIWIMFELNVHISCKLHHTDMEATVSRYSASVLLNLLTMFSYFNFCSPLFKIQIISLTGLHTGPLLKKKSQLWEFMIQQVYPKDGATVPLCDTALWPSCYSEVAKTHHSQTHHGVMCGVMCERSCSCIQ